MISRKRGMPGVDLKGLKGSLYSDPETEARKAARTDFMYREVNQLIEEESFWEEGGPDSGPRRMNRPPTMKLPPVRGGGRKERQ